MTPPLLVVDLGRRAYRPVLELQRALVQARIRKDLAEDLLVLVEHDPVVTLGRSTKASSLPVSRPLLEARGFTVEEVERGGDVTIHAPGQLVGYPILDLTTHREDVHWYLRQLEEALIQAVGALGIVAERNPGYTGVWTGGRKLASIGVHVKRWVTLHGFALNVTTDLSVFNAIVPCGIPGVVMSSVAAERPDLSSPWQVTVAAVTSAVASCFGRVATPAAADRLPVIRTALSPEAHNG